MLHFKHLFFWWNFIFSIKGWAIEWNHYLEWRLRQKNKASTDWWLQRSGEIEQCYQKFDWSLLPAHPVYEEGNNSWSFDLKTYKFTIFEL